MLQYILKQVICSTFESNFERMQCKKLPEERRAMRIEFCLNTHEPNEYRNMEMLIYGATNYVAVFTRLYGIDWSNEYRIRCYHDSCWDDGVYNVIKEFADDICIIRYFGKEYYTSIVVPKELDELIRKR